MSQNQIFETQTQEINKSEEETYIYVCIFRCCKCGKIITSTSWKQFEYLTERHLQKHGLKMGVDEHGYYIHPIKIKN